jgi:rSAM/selenodomain-associated transferase 2
MAAELSVIIPTLNAESELPACLGALFEGVTAGLICELIVSDGGSGDATHAIAREAGAVLITGAPSRGGQLRRAGALARGRWMLFVHADTVLEPGWSAAVARHVASEERAAAFRLAFAVRGLMPAWVAGWANLRARAFGLPYGDQGLVISRVLYERVGGYPDQPLMEDVAMVWALKSPPLLLPVRAVTDAGQYQRRGWLRRGAGNLWRQMRYAAGVDPENLVPGYRHRD